MFYIRSFNLKKSLVGQQTNFHEAYNVKAAHLDSSMYGKLPPLYSCDFQTRASRLKEGYSVSHEKVGDKIRIGAITEPMDSTTKGPQVHTRPWICKPMTTVSKASMGHSQIYNVKKSDFGITPMAIERFQQIDVASSCLQTGVVECEVFGADCSMYGSGHKDEPSLGWVHDESFKNLASTNAKTDSMDLQNQNCVGRKLVKDFVLSGLGSSKSVVVNTQG